MQRVQGQTVNQHGNNLPSFVYVRSRLHGKDDNKDVGVAAIAVKREKEDHVGTEVAQNDENECDDGTSVLCRVRCKRSGVVATAAENGENEGGAGTTDAEVGGNF